MPDGFQTMSFLRPAAPSNVAGTLRIEGEGRSSLDLAVDLMNLDPGQRYAVRFRPVAWCEPNVEVGPEVPREPSPDPAMADHSWIGAVAPFAADTHGQASFRGRVPGRLGVDWYAVTVVVSLADRTQGPWLACGVLGTVRLGAHP